MTIDLTKPVQTRDGRPARIIATDLAGVDYPVAAAVMSHRGAEIVWFYTTGGCINEAKTADPLDLINIPERVSWFRAMQPSCGMDVASYRDIISARFGHPNPQILEIVTIDGRAVEAIIHEPEVQS